MINKDNFADLLKHLGFDNKKNVFSKHFDTFDASLKVNFDKEEIIYPEDKGFTINERQTCNFSSNENFVVFECVYRLLSKGYKPSHIELEPKWKVGHGASGGRADILIKDNDKPLLIIECKTPGREFDKAWKETTLNGDQLFSYSQQIQDTDFLCLYTSDWIDNNIYYTSHIISHKDNKKILEENKGLKSFSQAKDFKQRYEVWRDTYQLEYTTKGIFEENIQPYHIGKDHYTIQDLFPVDAQSKEGKYHEFRTILRKHNVSGREKAFDVLVNLFLCKIVDESNNTNNLKFYWKGIAFDNYFDLIDRLQELYKVGMDKFLAQEIVYISNKEIDEAFWTVKQKRNATKQQIKDYFRKLKFFTNNDFGFIDVHNERLFYQNAKVLLEVVQMWQDLRLKTTEHNQFLGDMFEFFLDNGIKQSEGQFFTPMPICKFILMSLPLEEMVKNNPEPMHTIDYACGAGHFLTEYAAQITPFLLEHKLTDITDFYKTIVGVEKEYRLSKVAKLSSFMYGHEGIDIIHHDALGEHDKIKEASFNILVANPPFAVEGFLDTLTDDERNSYTLTKTVTDVANNRNIQCFFIERAKQLLSPGGVAGIIVPSSVLSNSDSTHIATREILLKCFDIVSLVELGSGTFGKTGTNTVVLFIRRKAQKPEPAVHFQNRVDDWFEGLENDEEMNVYQDLHLIKKYCELTQLPFDEYKSLLSGSPSEKLLETDMFKEYLKAFNAITDIIKLRHRPISKTFTEYKRNAELKKRQLEFLQTIEKDKLFYFLLAYNNPQKVLIVKSPSDGKEQKQYLGYEWSAAKGSEGIKYNGGDTVEKIITPLFDPANRYNIEKINYFIQQNFLGKEIPFNKERNNNNISYYPLVDLLDFSRKEMNKAFSLTPKKNISILTKWEVVNLEDVCNIVRGASPRPINNYISNEPNGINWIKIGDVNSNEKYITKTAEKITKEGAEKSRIVKVGDFILSNSMSFGRPYILKISGCIHDGWLLMTNFISRIDKDYLYEILSYDDTQKQFSESAAGGVVQNLNTERVKSTKIPLPPIPIQEEIVKECEAIDKEYQKALDTIEKTNNEIENKVTSLTQKYPTKKLSSLADIISGGTPNTKNSEYWNGNIPWLSVADFSKGGRFVSITEKTISELGLKNSSTKYLNKGDIIISARGTVGALAQLTVPMTFNQSCYGLRGKEDIDNGYLYYVLKQEVKQFRDNASGVTFGAITISTFNSINIPVPPLKEQRQLISAIEKLEDQISEAQKIINEAAQRKQDIMKKYL